MGYNYSFDNSCSKLFTDNHTNQPFLETAKRKQNTNLLFTLAIVLLTFLSGDKLLAQVTITKPNLSIPVCSGFPSSYYNLGNIVITETAITNFSNGNNQTLILTAPTNFEFLINSATVVVSGPNISLDSFSNNTTTITIQYDISNDNKLDLITISGLQVRAINTASTGNITRTGGTGTINGLINTTTLTNTLTSTSGTTPPAIGGGAATVCTGLTTPAFTNATGGGTWSITNGTGSATITSGGVVSGVTAGTVTVVYSVGICSVSTLLTVNTNPAAIGGGATTVCTGVTTAAFTNATGGGTWSITPGTGTASITSGGIVTGLTAGTVTVVYTLGTCAVTKVLTINQTPSTIGGGSATVCTGATTAAFTNTNGGGTWSITNGTGSATITSGGVVTGVTAGNVTVVYTLGTCTPATVALTVNTVPSASITPSPMNTATGVCYAGSGAITSISWAATATATSYDVYFAAGSLPGSVTANVATNAYTTGALTANTIYYWRVVAKNSCGDAASSATWSFTTAATPCVVYCTPTASSGVDGTGITNVSYSSVNNTTNNTLVYNNYTSFVGNVIQGAAMPISVTTATGNKRYNIKIWVDWNDDGDFDDAGEEMFSGNVLSNTISGIINVPLTAIVGNHRMRVGITQGQGNGANYEIATPCFTGVQGAFEDYSINVTPAVVCTLAPTLTTSPANTTMASNGTTTLTAAFANGPTNFVWEVSSDGGTNFTTITNTGVYSGANTTALTITNPTGVLNGFIYRVTASNACGTSPVSATALLTVTITYCTPASSTIKHWIATVFSDGNLNDTSYSGVPAYSTSPVNGYGNYSSTVIATQTPGGGVNISYILGSSEPSTFNLNLQRVSCFVDWNGDGDFIDSGEIVYTTANVGVTESSFGFVVPVSQNPGIYRLRIRTRQTIPPPAIDGCTAYTTGETEDYSIAIVPDCAARIQSVTNGSVCGTNNVVTLGAIGLGGTTQYRWYDSELGGSLIGTSASSSWTTPPLPATTFYYVAAFNGSCESLTRTPVKATVNPTTNITFSPSSPTVCGENNIISIEALGDTVELDLLNESFESGFGSFSLTTITNNSNTGPQANAPWSVRTNTYQPTDTSVWRPAINSGNISENFAITTSDYSLQTLDTRLTTTNNINTIDFINLTLTFNHYYSDYGGEDTASVEVSTNGGTSWLPANIVATYNSDLGAASRFTEVSINLNAYIGLTNLKFRFKYVAGWNDGWAIDDVRLFGTKQLNTTFSWSDPGVDAYIDLACTIPYVAQSVTTIYVKPTATQLEDDEWSFTATATLGNGCPVTQVITVTNKSKIWQGLNGDWNDANNWKPNGIPTANDCVIIKPQAFPSAINSGADGLGKNLTVKSGGNLNIAPDKAVTITDFVNVDVGGTFQIENNGSLVQVYNVANTGSITYKRTADNINGYDYVYWSSPVSNQSLAGIYTSPTQGPKYQWNTTVNNGNTGQGNWEAAAATMTIGKGYIVRGSSNFGMAPTNINSTFIGVPNNGDIPITVYRGTYTGADYAGANGSTITNLSDNYNLLGNPYPSAINGLQFLSDNSGVIEGSVDLWKHVTAPTTGVTNPFYGSFTYNYASSYETINFTGSTIPPPPGIPWTIKAGQAFFVKMKDGAAGSSTVIFNNGMRNANYSNSGFFKTSNNNDAPLNFENIERHRIWLDIVASNNTSERALIGYVSGATLEEDHFYDAITIPSGSIDIYSLISNQTYNIQGRPLPFSDNDLVPLGYKAGTSGSYHIAINALDGLFETQNIYLEDLNLQIIHDLKLSPYLFTTESGIFNNRFVLRYTNSTLSNSDFEFSNAIQVVVNEKVAVYSSIENIKEIEIFDVLGRKIDLYKNVNEKQFQLNKLRKTMSTLILKIKLSNDVIINKKIIF